MNKYLKSPLSNVSFFYNERSGSGKIRGEQMGKYLGAKLNPTEGYENDLCIYVKIQPPEDYPKNSYFDIVDGVERMPWIREHPDMRVIACSECAYDYLKNEIPNEITLIPQHHCNFERMVSKTNGNKFGVVGGKGAIQEKVEYLFDDFIWKTDYKNREDVFDTYQRIDKQVIWRKNNVPLKNSLKIVNAMSFGIPTIAYPEIGYSDVDGYYFKANTVEELKKLIREPLVYDKDKLINKAEEYHIENISKKYEEL